METIFLNEAINCASEMESKVSEASLPLSYLTYVLTTLNGEKTALGEHGGLSTLLASAKQICFHSFLAKTASSQVSIF